MSTLAQRQESLLQALLDWPADESSDRLMPHLQHASRRGLLAYRTNGHAAAERALRAAYPVVAQLLGDASFDQLARALWHAHPPVRGDLGQWGEALPDFLRASVQLQDEPYLGDVAQAEWAIHLAHGAGDVAADLTSLALLTTHAPEQLTLVLAPGLATLGSAWPLASILVAHRDGSISFAEVGTQIRRREAQEVVIWREAFTVQVRQAFAGEVDFLRAVAAGSALTAALDAAPGLDFSGWLPIAVQSALVLAVTSVSTNPTP